MRDRPFDLVTDRGQLDLGELARAAAAAEAAGRALVQGAAWFQCAEGESMLPSIDIPNPLSTSPVPIITVPPGAPPPSGPPPATPPVQIVTINGSTYLVVGGVYFLLLNVGGNPVVPQPAWTCFTELVKVCPVKDADGKVTGLINMVRSVCLPVPVLLGAPYCLTDPAECCPSGVTPPPPPGCVAVACCDLPVSPALTLTDGATGRTATLTYQAGYLGYPPPGAWTGTLPLLGGGALLFVLYCDPNSHDWTLAFSDGGPTLLLEAQSVSCSPTLALAFSAPAAGGPPCASCAGASPTLWSCSIAGAGGGLAGVNGDWGLSSVGPCTWIQEREDGTTLILTITANGPALQYNAGPAGSPDATWLWGRTWAGDCCSPVQVGLVLTSGGTAPQLVTLTPSCPAGRSFAVAGPACPPAPGGGGPTVTVACCPNPIPETIHAVLSGTGACDGTYALSWDAGAAQWQTFAPLGACPDPGKPSLALVCGADAFLVLVNGVLTVGTPTPTCDPLHVQQTGVAELASECGCTAGTITFME